LPVTYSEAVSSIQRTASRLPAHKLKLAGLGFIESSRLLDEPLRLHGRELVSRSARVAGRVGSRLGYVVDQQSGDASAEGELH
jgi:hypothetical protein